MQDEWVSTALVVWSIVAFAGALVLGLVVGLFVSWQRAFSLGAIVAAIGAIAIAPWMAEWFPGPALGALAYAFIIPLWGALLGGHTGDFIEHGPIDSGTKIERSRMQVYENMLHHLPEVADVGHDLAIEIHKHEVVHTAA